VFWCVAKGYFEYLKNFPSARQVDLSTRLQVFSYNTVFSSSFHRNNGSISKGSWKKLKGREECHSVLPGAGASETSLSSGAERP
jgi:hypothetical protein